MKKSPIEIYLKKHSRVLLIILIILFLIAIFLTISVIYLYKKNKNIKKKCNTECLINSSRIIKEKLSKDIKNKK